MVDARRNPCACKQGITPIASSVVNLDSKWEITDSRSRISITQLTVTIGNFRLSVCHDSLGLLYRNGLTYRRLDFLSPPDKLIHPSFLWLIGVTKFRRDHV